MAARGSSVAAAATCLAGHARMTKAAATMRYEADATAASDMALPRAMRPDGLRAGAGRGHRLPADAQALDRVARRVILLDVVVTDAGLGRRGQEPRVVDRAAAQLLERFLRHLAFVVLHRRAGGLVLEVDQGHAARVLLDHLHRIHSGDARPEGVELQPEQVAGGLFQEHVDRTHALDRLELERV